MQNPNYFVGSIPGEKAYAVRKTGKLTRKERLINEMAFVKG